MTYCKAPMALLSLAFGLILAGPVAAEDKWCSPAAGTRLLSQDDVKAALEAKGYKVKAMDTEHGCIEAKGFDNDGKRVEIYVHPASGEIVKIKG